MNSVLQTKKERFFCKTTQNLHGFTVYLCLNHHTNGGEAVHRNPNGPLDRYLKELAQKYWEENNGTREEFIKTFGRNYL